MLPRIQAQRLCQLATASSQTVNPSSMMWTAVMMLASHAANAPSQTVPLRLHCLADASCATGQACAKSCACGDDACSLKCVAQNPSPKAVPVANCIQSNCEPQLKDVDR